MFELGEVINGQFLVQQRFIGGMGVVYVAIDEVTEKTVVLKTLRDDLSQEAEKELAQQDDLHDRFEREARAWINLGFHPYIVPAIAFQRGTPPFLQLEYIDGTPLNCLIRSEPLGLAQREALRYASHLAQGLQHAHQCPMPRGKRGVIHRDVKPHNVLIQRDRVARLTDFGLACVHGDDRLTSSKSVMGTLRYMPPEQYGGLLQTTDRSDIYSLGVVIFEMLTGRLPFPGPTVPELWYQVQECRPPHIRDFRDDVCQELDELVMQCLAKQPEGRPESAALVARHLVRIAEQLPVSSESSLTCATCGYEARRQHLLCPICQHPPQEKRMPVHWSCDCGASVPALYRFCLKCGLPRRQASVCPACQKSNPQNFHYCCYCGGKLVS